MRLFQHSLLAGKASQVQSVLIAVLFILGMLASMAIVIVFVRFLMTFGGA